MRRGLTLIEVLITLFLMALALGLVGSLLRTYAVILRQENPHDEFLQLARLASVRLTAAVHAASEVETPRGPSWEPRLALKQPVTPLPSPLPDPRPESWDPFEELREVRFNANTLGVDEFRCRLESPRLVEIELKLGSRTAVVRAEGPLL